MTPIGDTRIVFALSNTHSLVEPPNAARQRSSERATVSEVSSATRTTCMYLEYFSRPAKKCTRWVPVAVNVISTCPKSNCAYSPGSPSKSTTGSFFGFGRSCFTRAAIWLRPPRKPHVRARR